MKKQFNRAATQLSYLPQTLSLVWAASQYWTLSWIIVIVIQGLLPLAILYLTPHLVNRLVTVVGAGISWSGIQPIIIPGILVAATLLLTELMRSIAEWVSIAQGELVQDYISDKVQQKSIEVDLAFYESSEYYDYLSRARSDARDFFLALLENLGNLLQSSITLLGMTAILFTYGPVLPFMLLVGVFPGLLIIIQLNKAHYQWWQEKTADRRKIEYYETLLIHYLPATEVRIFNLGSCFQSAYKRLRFRLRKERMELVKQQILGRLFATGISFLLSSFALIWMVKKLLAGMINLGDLALFYQIFNQGQTLMRSLLSNIAQIHTNSLFISNLFEFLQLQPQIIDSPQPQPLPAKLQNGICFENVTFRYPGSQQTVLENFNLTIPAGKIVAIIGDNGAGKSTLVKLLCRFYDPEAGKILLDGTDLRDFSVNKLRNLITVLFQFPIRYQFSVEENIALGDIFVKPETTEIETAAKAAGIHEMIQDLPKGYQTRLGKMFSSGVDLSGGEWQRLALARAFYRRAQVMILDEPTSAMDPWSEYDWLERFRTLAEGQTAVVITHRFTLAMRADIIYMMQKGKIIESGNHEQLLKKGGLYAQSWQEQMQTEKNI
ncbi:MAG: ABC transporter ATP-binding protein [Cyanobacteriota bacterium]|nr:ABC transporter ATP-binding protein [Cyanobacteriota bacterium]